MQIIGTLDSYIASIVPLWANLPLFSKICFVAAVFGLVLYIGLVVRGRIFKADEKRNSK
jgi:hypothetical protein